MAQNKFLVDVELMNDERLFTLGQKWGREKAFAWYIYLLSLMRKQAGNRIHNRPEFISRLLGMPTDEVTRFVADLLRAKLIQKDRKGNLWSQNLSNSVADYDARCETNRNNRLLKNRRVENKPVELLPIIDNESKSNRITNAKISTNISTNISTSTNNIPNTVPSTGTVPEKEKMRAKKQRPTIDELLAGIVFPDNWGDAEARLVLGEWLKYKQLRGELYKRQTELKMLIKRFANGPLSELERAICFSISNTYQGIFEPKKQKSLTLYSDEIKKRNEETIRRFISSND